ncbi:hypothetical protein VTL71DRAFT_8806 [Oculimacula yallundae]|uniref:Nuclear protein MDM1 n=1 Tax=Oculimacula yallundae TaxID=86028 RepID=A0ABR4CYT1_9HELO
MADEEKPKRIPSWDDSQRPPAPLPARRPTPQAPSYRAGNVNTQRHPSNFQQRPGNVVAGYGQYQAPMFPNLYAQDPMQMLAQNHMQMFGLLMASADPSAVTSMGHYGGHLKPNFVFGGSHIGANAQAGVQDVGNGFPHVNRAVVPKQEQGVAAVLPLLPSKPPVLEIEPALQPQDTLPTVDSVLRKTSSTTPCAASSESHDSTNSPPADSSNTISRKEADIFLDGMSANLLSKTKIEDSSTIVAPNIIPSTPKLNLSKQGVIAASPSPIPTGPRSNKPSIRPPAAPIFQRLDDNQDIHRDGSALLRESTKFSQSPRSGLGEIRDQASEAELRSSSKGVKQNGSGKDVGENRHCLRSTLLSSQPLSHRQRLRLPPTRRRNSGREAGKDNLRKLSREKLAERLEKSPGSTMLQIPTGPKAIRKKVPRRRNRSTKAGAQTETSLFDVPFKPQASVPTSSALGTISIPINHRNPFFLVDFFEPPPDILARRQKYLFGMEDQYRKAFKKTVQARYKGSLFERKGGHASGWDGEKARMLEKLAIAHCRDRRRFERSHVKSEKTCARDAGIELVKSLEVGETDIEHVRRKIGFGNVTAGVTLTVVGKDTGDDAETDTGKMVLCKGREENANVSSGGTLVYSDPRCAVHYTLLLRNSLRGRHERELRWLDENTTAQERAEIAKRQRDEWDEWLAALPLREVVSRREVVNRRGDLEGYTQGGNGDRPTTARQEIGRQRRPSQENMSDHLGRHVHFDPPAAAREYLQPSAGPTSIRSTALNAPRSRPVFFPEAGMTEQERQELLLRQKEEAEEWQAAQLLEIQQQQLADDALFGDIMGEGLKCRKRKAAGEIDGGMHRKRVRSNTSVHTGLEVSDSRSTMANTCPVLEDTGGGNSNNAQMIEATRPCAVGSAEAAEAKAILRPYVEKAKGPINNIDEPFVVGREVDTYLQDAIGNEVEIGVERKSPSPVEPIRLPEVKKFTSVADDVVAADQNINSPRADQASQLIPENAPVPRGEWILDSLLDNLGGQPAPSGPASPSPPSTHSSSTSSPPTPSERKSCVVS